MEELTFFDRLNIAHCAMQRAKMLNPINQQRFMGEYTTARQWMKYKCYINKTVSFVEPN